MSSSEQEALEKYKQSIADAVFNLDIIQKHIQTYYQNLTQTSEEPTPEVLLALKNTIKVIVSKILDKGLATVGKDSENFRQEIIDAVADLFISVKEDPDIQKCQSDIRVAFIKSIGLDNAMGRRALIRHSDLSFVLFFNDVAQSALYKINNLDIRKMTQTDDERAEFAEKFGKENERKGEKGTDVIDTDKRTGDIEKDVRSAVEQILGKSENKN